MKSIKELNRIIKDCYEIFVARFNGRYLDEDWSNVLKVKDLFEFIPGVKNVQLSGGEYKNYILFSNNGLTPYKLYYIEIETDFGYIDGELQCCSAGSIENPFSSYDMIISLSPRKEDIDIDSINESIINDNFKIRNIINELKEITDFEDLLTVVKKNIRKGILAGTIISMVLVNFDLTNKLKELLKEEAYQTETEYYNQDEARIYKVRIEPEWELIADDVHGTVYNAKESQCNSDPEHTSSGFYLDTAHASTHKVIAVERSMMNRYDLNYGDIVKIEGAGALDGEYQILDVMNSRYKNRNRIDFLVNSDITSGQWNNLKMYKLINQEDSDIFRSLMAPAKNQDSIDRVQSNKLHESLSLINFGNSGILKSNKVDTTEFFNKNMLLNAIKKTLINADIDQIDERAIEINPADTEYLLDSFDVFDVNRDNSPLLEDVVITTDLNGKLHKHRTPQARLRNKLSKDFIRILYDDETKNIHICIPSIWGTPYFTISKPIIDFITLLPVKSIGVFYSYSNKIDICMNEGEKMPVLRNVGKASFFHTKNWKGENYYLPFTLKPNEKLEDKYMLSLEFVKHFPKQITSKCDPDKLEITIYTAMFPTLSGYIKVIKPFVNAGYVVRDEFNNVYNETNIDSINISELEDDITPESLQNKLQAIEDFLKSTLGDTLLLFDEVVNNKTLRHIYLREFFSYNRKQKNIYKKLSMPVILQFISDNGIDLDNLIQESCNESDRIRLELNEIDINNIDFNKLKELGEDFEKYLPSFDYVTNYYFKSTHNNLLKTEILSKNIHSLATYDNYLKSAMTERFYYKFFTKLYKENPNGWNNDNTNFNRGYIFNLMYITGYYGSSLEWVDFGNKNINTLAIDTHDSLMFFLYDLGYALKNSYSQLIYGPTMLAIDLLDAADDEPLLNTIDYTAIVKCLNTILNDMLNK